MPRDVPLIAETIEHDIKPESLPQNEIQAMVIALLTVVVLLVGYGIGPTRLPLVGEETCRAQHGIEMVQTGDWITARNQGRKILDRPPMQYWTLAAIHKWIHELDPMTIRVSMVVILLTTALMTLWYARRFLSPAAAFVAAVAYPTMGHVFDLGRRAETDGQFTFHLVAALMVWHYGYEQRWARPAIWAFGAVLAALATLTKGLQGPVTFFGTVYLFLLLRRDWQYLLHWSHVTGVLLFLGIIAVWQVPFYLREGWPGTELTWLVPSAARMSLDLTLVKHLASFPFEVLGSTLPWSALLAGLLFPKFWKLDEKARSCLLFILIAMVTIFAPVWITAGGSGRYVMPMYPLIGIVGAVVVHRALSLDLSFALRRFWRDYLRVMAIIVVVSAVLFVGVTLVGEFNDDYWVRTLSQPWWLAAAILTAAVGGAVVTWSKAASPRQVDSVVATWIVALLMAVLFNGPILNAHIINAEDLKPKIAALRGRLPADAKLVTFGPISHKFLYWYGYWYRREIPIVPLPTTPTQVPADLEYFAVSLRKDRAPPLPFRYEELARLNMDRTKKDSPRDAVLVGRRLPDP
jgi:4-amino-4-deoxy-L-arabinose transferase-like glycosyltransferase